MNWKGISEELAFKAIGNIKRVHQSHRAEKLPRIEKGQKRYAAKMMARQGSTHAALCVALEVIENGHVCVGVVVKPGYPLPELVVCPKCGSAHGSEERNGIWLRTDLGKADQADLKEARRISMAAGD